MVRKSRRGAKATYQKERQLNKWLWRTVPILVLLIGGGWLLSRGQKDVVVEIRAEIIPREGAQTSYGIPLSLNNTRRFIDYYNVAALTPEQENTMRDALLPLKAPCCDDNSMATCCCPCNLAKAVWGLSGYLVAEKNYRVEEVGEAALQWLRFIHSDYYVIQEMRNRGIDPALYGLFHEDPCYVGECELPFKDGGCGGMGER